VTLEVCIRLPEIHAIDRAVEDIGTINLRSIPNPARSYRWNDCNIQVPQWRYMERVHDSLRAVTEQMASIVYVVQADNTVNAANGDPRNR